MGSTIWVDKGVKCLIPNGRNEDGTLKNIEYITDSVRIVQQTASNSNLRRLFMGVGNLLACFNSNYFEGKDGEQPTTTATAYRYYYAYDTNIVYVSPANTTTWTRIDACDIAKFTCSTTAVLTLSPKTTFRAVDYNDLTDLLPTGAVISSASSTSPKGFLLANGSAVSRTTYAKLFSAIGTTYGIGDGSTTFNLPNYSNYNFVTSATVGIKGNGKALGLVISNQNTSIFPMKTGSSNSDGISMNASQNTSPAVGASMTSTAISGNTQKAVGISPNSSLSGLTGSVTTAKINWYIKY
jgi:microcystin-dependent protein